MQPMGGPPVRKRRRWPWVVGGVLAAVVMLCCGVTVGSLVFDAERGQRLDAVETTGPPGPPAVAGTGSAPVAPTSAAPAGPKTSITEGIWNVGTEVVAGTYRTTVPKGSFGCYYARLRGFSGAFSDIIANGNLAAGATGRVTIAPTDKGFQAVGDCTWEKVV